MGGSGGRYFPKRTDALQKRIERARQTAERQRLDSDVSKFLQDVLTTFNQRDAEKVQEYLGKIMEILGEGAQVEQFLFGGSVAKHTYVDGLSDVDALVILDRADLAGKSPEAVLKAFHKQLQDGVTYDIVQSVEKGKMAVTVTHQDGTEVQLLPALRVGGKVAIPDATRGEWKETNPKAFQRALSKANERLSHSLVPTIKLVKSIISGFSKQKRLTGYHVESLALDAAKGYRGARTGKALLVHVLESASKRVLRPIRDVTGQSRVVDSSLGRSNSPDRRLVADALASVARRLNAATSLDQWKAVIED